jgi:hypothetical protein
MGTDFFSCHIAKYSGSFYSITLLSVAVKALFVYIINKSKSALSERALEKSALG